MIEQAFVPGGHEIRISIFILLLVAFPNRTHQVLNEPLLTTSSSY